MTISLVGAGDAQPSNTGSATITLSGTEGNLQTVYFVHRTSTQTPAQPTGTGWSTLVLGETLIETEIANTSARRAIAVWWRVVPAGAAATITLDWQVATACVGVGFEWSTDTVGGTWSFDGTNFNDNGTTAGTSLASNSVTPSNNEAVAVDGLCARHADVADQDTYDSSFITGPSATTSNGAVQNQVSGAAGYRIVDTTPAATSTTASWGTSTLATSLIGVWSVDTGAGAGQVDLISHAIQVTHQPLSATAAGSATVDLASHSIVATHHALTISADTGTVDLGSHSIQISHQPLNVTGTGAVTVDLASHAAQVTHRPLTVFTPTTVVVDLHFIALAPELGHGSALAPELLERAALAPELAHAAVGAPETVDRSVTAPELGHGDSSAPELGHGQPEVELGHGNPDPPEV